MDFKQLFKHNKVVVAPMAGLTNTAFRLVLSAFNPALIYTEMVSDQAINYRNQRTLDMLYIDEEETRVVLQLFGASKTSMAKAVEYVSKDTKAVMLDLNVGCPVPKVIKTGAGSALMNDPKTVYEMVKAMCESTHLPVSVKIRAGWDQKNINAVEVAQQAEKAGAALIAIHGRTKKQLYSGKADLSIIKAVKDAVQIPVIGNGDIVSPEDAKQMLQETGVDAVMIGRGLKGNPWLIKQINDYLMHGEYETDITPDMKIDMLKDHTNQLVKLKGETVALQQMRTHGAWYLKGLPHASQVKVSLMRVKDKQTLFETLEAYRKQLKED